MYYKSLFFVCALIVSFQLTINAQNDLSSLLLQDSWQMLNTNPAKQPNGVLVNLPGIYSNFWITNVTFNDLVKEENGTNTLDISNAISKLEEQNFIREDFDFETIGVGFKVGKLGVNFGHRVRISGLLDYPKTLAQLIWEGNAQFIGQEVNFGPSLDFTAYHELALGLSYDIDDNVHIGARIKHLSGISNVSTERNDLSLSTSDDVYQLELQADYLINSAGILTYNGIDDIGLDFNLDKVGFDKLFGKNNGVAFDLGIAVALGKIHLSASAIDLGAEINWEENVNNYNLNGEFEFDGLDIAQTLFDDESSFGNVLDSLSDTYNPVEAHNAYTTTTGSKFYFSGQYELSDQMQMGLILFTDNYHDVKSSALALSASMQLTSLIRVGGFYGLRNERFDNLGANISFHTNVLNLHLATDNILSVFNVKDANLANFRIGLNLLFGPSKDKMESNGGSQFY